MLAEVVQEAAEAVTQLARERGSELRLAVPPNLPLLPADRDRLMQVLINLLSNAIKATVPGRPGRIAVLAWPEDNSLRLCVEDNGKGIALAEQPQLFDKFFQAHHQTMRKPEGSGLGLAITKKIVELHQGRIWVESAPGAGGPLLYRVAAWRVPVAAAVSFISFLVL
ncbi:MAG: ATP-binding protein [Hymenobacter sp.]